ETKSVAHETKTITHELIYHYARNQDHHPRNHIPQPRNHYPHVPVHLGNPQLEEALALWVENAQQHDIPISGNLIRTVAVKFSDKLDIPENQRIKFSNGWQHRFQDRYGVKMNRVHGESGSADTAAVEANIDDIRNEVSKYRPEDVYNMDETALYYRNAPCTTISNHSIQGFKEDKKRLTIAFTGFPR
ncbi:hypothetical protein O0I10_013052, partial [Lichtheimia ornata]